MEKLIDSTRNYILPGLIGLAASLIAGVKELQLLLWLNYPTSIKVLSGSPIENLITLTVTFCAIYVIFRNVSTWWKHKYAMSLLFIVEGCVLASALILSLAPLTINILYIVIGLLAMQIVAATFLVLTDYNFVDGGHKKWIKL